MGVCFPPLFYRLCFPPLLYGKEASGGLLLTQALPQGLPQDTNGGLLHTPVYRRKTTGYELISSHMETFVIRTVNISFYQNM